MGWRTVRQPRFYQTTTIMYPNAVIRASIRGSAPVTPGFAGMRLLQYALKGKGQGQTNAQGLENDILSVSYDLFLQGRTPALPLLLQPYRGKYKGYLSLLQELDRQKIESNTTEVGSIM